jgi:hypothetical protein
VPPLGWLVAPAGISLAVYAYADAHVARRGLHCIITGVGISPIMKFSAQDVLPPQLL